MPDSSVRSASWSELTTDELYAILKLRTDVFFVEQRVDETELDDRDQEPGTRHYWIEDGPTLPVPHDASASGGRAVGRTGCAAYIRVLLNDRPEHLDARHIIGRVVVRADRRGEGLAQVLLTRALEDLAGHAILLHAQQYIEPLYAKFGFEAFGEPYVEATIMHISMYRAATP